MNDGYLWNKLDDYFSRPKPKKRKQARKPAPKPAQSPAPKPGPDGSDAAPDKH